MRVDTPRDGLEPYRQLFWDLDGTLTDPRDGIVRSVTYALERLGRTVDRRTLERFIGPPLAHSFRVHYGLGDEELAQAVALYRERYGRIGWRENRPVAGIEPLLRDLARRGVAMAVATLKPRPLAERILDHFGLRPLFAGVYAPAPEIALADKRELLGEALAGRPWGGPGRAAMVGDHEDDVRAAHRWNLDSVAVLYGYGERAALLAAGPTATAVDADALRAILLP